MNKPELFSRRDFLNLIWRYGPPIVGATLVAVGGGGLVYRAIQAYEADHGAAPVDNNFYKADATNIPPHIDAAGAAATTAPYPGATQETAPSDELKPLVDKFKIADRISLSSAEPMKWLIVLSGDRAILTPTAKPYAYSQENEDANIFDWHKHTTYTYLEQNGTPILWGHEGVSELFFNSLADFLRKPYGGGWVTKREAEKAMRENLLGAKVYLMQAKDEALLPETTDDVDFKRTDIRIVKMEVVAGLFVPRWQKVDVLDENGLPKPETQVTYDGGGWTVDWVTHWYDQHTNDIYEAIRTAYPDHPDETNDTHDQFLALPDGATLGVKFCIRPLAGDAPAPDKDANGDVVIPASYGRFFMALKVTGTTAATIPSWSHEVA